MTTKTLLDRLLPKASISAETGCWNWAGAKYESGYGQFYVRGKHQKAHRVSYEIHCGEIPRGLCVCHRCDNPTCINPDHLFLGTNADNVADKVAKGRQSRARRAGSANGNAKLTEADVVSIRSATNTTQRALAAQYGVQRSQISLILSGKRW